MANDNMAGAPDAQIDSADYVMNIIRGIRKYPDKRAAEVKARKYPEDAKGASLQQEKAFDKGYLAALADMKIYLDTVSRGI